MQKRKFHIRSDMEGVAGVVSLTQVKPDSPEYPEARTWLMAELVALSAGLLEGGAEEVSIYDEHWFGRNIDISRIPSGVRVISGKPPYRADWAGGLDARHTGMILHGFHSMEGAGHTLSHTYEPDFQAIRLNGRPVGEIAIETAIAGDCGVPLVLIIADSAGAEEAQRLVPGTKAVVTKISCGRDAAECLALPDVLADIRAKALDVARQPPPAQPFRVKPPVELVCIFNEGPYLEGLRRRRPANFTGANTFRLVGPTTTAVWADYWQVKLQVQRDLATP